MVFLDFIYRFCVHVIYFHFFLLCIYFIYKRCTSNYYGAIEYSIQLK